MKIKRDKLSVYSIQENGLVSVSKMADGRLIPAVVLNSKNGEELKDFLRAHVSSIAQGDVTTQWATPLSQFFKPKYWILSVNFSKPREFSFYIEFSLEKNFALIDAIFQSRGLYVLHGYPGDKISKRTSQDMVLMEIPDLNQDSKWSQTLREVLKDKYKKQKIPKRELNQEVERQIRKMREILHYRRE